MSNFRLLRTSLHVHFKFQRPILQWQEVYGRFFNMIYDAQTPKFPVAPNEFSLQYGANIGEFRARYNILGGASTVTLSADRLSFEFPGMLENEHAIALEIMGAVHDKLPQAFDALTYDRVDVESYQHLELQGGITPDQFLQRFGVSSVDRALKDNLNAIVQPAMKVNVVDADQAWRCSFGVEPSLLSAAAVFVTFQLALLKPDPAKTFFEKAAEVQDIGSKLLASAGLEDAAST